MTTKIQICNMALVHTETTKLIQALDESSKEASILNLFYDMVLREILEAAPWNFANKTAALALVGELSGPEWWYSYRYPSDAVKIRKLYDATVVPSTTRIPFVQANDASGRLIYANYPDMYAQYTMLVTNTEIYPAPFVSLLSFALAAKAAPALAKDSKVIERCIGMAEAEFRRASSSDANESEPAETPDAEWVRARS